MSVNPLAMMLKGFGFQIDPDEVIRMVQNMAKDIADMRASIKHTEAIVERMENERNEHGGHDGNSGDGAIPLNSGSNRSSYGPGEIHD